MSQIVRIKGESTGAYIDVREDTFVLIILHELTIELLISLKRLCCTVIFECADKKLLYKRNRVIYSGDKILAYVNIKRRLYEANSKN